MSPATSDETAAEVRTNSDDPLGPAASSPADAPMWALAADDFVAWREGDPGALDRLVRRLTPVLWQLARAYGLDREAADDVVQTTWYALIHAGDSVRDPQAVLRWTTTTARREAWRTARLSRREDAVESDVLDGAAPVVAGPEDAVLTDGSARSLWRHVASLTPRCRRLLRVIAFEERPDYASLSRELGMAVGSIGPNRMRCLQKLRQLLAADPEWREQ